MRGNGFRRGMSAALALCLLFGTLAGPALAIEGAQAVGAQAQEVVPAPSNAASAPTEAASNAPTNAPTSAPTNAASEAPTNAPTSAPTNAPSNAPGEAPTNAPTNAPNNAPTNAASEAPTSAPTSAPTNAASEAPSSAASSAPTNAPTNAPTEAPSSAPTIAPSATADMPAVEDATIAPSAAPEASPSPESSASPEATVLPTIFGFVETAEQLRFEVHYGTPLEELGLPERLTARAADGAAFPVEVQWHCVSDGMGGAAYLPEHENPMVEYSFAASLAQPYPCEAEPPLASVVYIPAMLSMMALDTSWQDWMEVGNANSVTKSPDGSWVVSGNAIWVKIKAAPPAGTVLNMQSGGSLEICSAGVNPDNLRLKCSANSSQTSVEITAGHLRLNASDMENGYLPQRVTANSGATLEIGGTLSTHNADAYISIVNGARLISNGATLKGKGSIEFRAGAQASGSGLTLDEAGIGVWGNFTIPLTMNGGRLVISGSLSRLILGRNAPIISDDALSKIQTIEFAAAYFADQSEKLKGGVNRSWGLSYMSDRTANSFDRGAEVCLRMGDNSLGQRFYVNQWRYADAKPISEYKVGDMVDVEIKLFPSEDAKFDWTGDWIRIKAAVEPLSITARGLHFTKQYDGTNVMAGAEGVVRAFESDDTAEPFSDFVQRPENYPIAAAASVDRGYAFEADVFWQDGAPAARTPKNLSSVWPGSFKDAASDYVLTYGSVKLSYTVTPAPLTIGGRMTYDPGLGKGLIAQFAQSALDCEGFVQPGHDLSSACAGMSEIRFLDAQERDVTQLGPGEHQIAEIAATGGNYALHPENFSICVLKRGEGSVTLDDWAYADGPKSPVCASATHAADPILSYASAELDPDPADDAAWSAEKPSHPGNYVVRAVWPAQGDWGTLV